MKCPYCGKEMENGYIPSGKMALMWIPKGECVPSTIFNKTMTGVNLTKVPFWTIQKAESFYCEACKVVITPVIEEEINVLKEDSNMKYEVFDNIDDLMKSLKEKGK